MAENQYDVIVIGSGVGGLTCASLIAQLENSRVLLLERHSKTGGFTHSFEREDRYEWDVGVHYVGEMNPGSHYRALFDAVTDQGLRWKQMPEVFDRFIYPRTEFGARCGLRRFRQDLIERYPHEEAALQRYFQDLIAASRWYGRLMFARLLPAWLGPTGRLFSAWGRKLGMMTTGEYLRSHIGDPELRAVLASQWGNAGLPPGQSAFAVHAVIACHYLDGGYYPIGGASKIAASVIPIVKRHGGEVLTGHRVERILLDGDTAIGVATMHRAAGKDKYGKFYARRIISAVGAGQTYRNFLPARVSARFSRELADFPAGSAHVCAYIGFRESPESLGFKGENCWIYSDLDHDRLFSRRAKVIDGEIGSCFLAFPSLKNPLADGHTAELIAFVDQQAFSRWEGTRWGRRGAEYEQMKQRIGDALVDFVDRRFPGFAEQVDYCEVSTPLSTENFTGHPGGCIYGLPGFPGKLQARWLTPRTPVRNLYLTGSDIAGHGIVGALMGGVMTLLVASRRRLAVIRLLVAAMRLARHPEQRDVLQESMQN